MDTCASSPHQAVLRSHQSCGILGAPRGLGLHVPQGAASWGRETSLSVRGSAPPGRRGLSLEASRPRPQAPARLLEERRVSGPGPEGGVSPVPGAQRSRPRRVGVARSPAQSGRRVTPPALGLCERWSPTHRPLQQPLLPERAAQLDLGDAFSGFPWSARGRLRRGPRQPCRSPTPSCTLSPTHGPHHPPRVLSGRKQLWSKDRVTEAALCSG